jgi:hypothetical protein
MKTSHHSFKTKTVQTPLLYIAFAILLFGSCQKNINEAPATQSTQQDALFGLKKYDAAVATDWYKMQMRLLLHKNSTLANGVLLGYVGIGLYEAVKDINPNAISFSEKLYKMAGYAQNRTRQNV